MVNIMEVVDADDLNYNNRLRRFNETTCFSHKNDWQGYPGVKLVKLDDGTKISSISGVINDENPGLDQPKNHKHQNSQPIKRELV